MPLVTDGLPSPLRAVHILGIAGTAMGALAGMLKDAGFQVTGSDTGCYPPMSDYLQSLQIPVLQGWNAANLDYGPDLVVIGNVMRADYEEVRATLDRDLPYCSFPYLLGEMFLKRAHSVVVAGTHGKTTTTALTAWLLEAAGREPGFLIGGLARNFPRTARTGGGQWFVVEGDEYDTAFFDKRPKFVHYKPNTVILTSVEFDHADIYRDLDHVMEAFIGLMRLVPSDGRVIARGDDPNVREVTTHATCPVSFYGPGFEWDGRIDSVDTDRGTMTFTVLHHGSPVGTFSSCMVGTHNLYNQVAAAAVALSAGATVAQLAEGFSGFLGIRRRQELRGEPGSVAVIDDFAHHPTAVKVTLQALRQRFGARRLWAVWEPRSATSRRAVFQDDYARAFDDADQVIIAAPFDQARIAEEDRFSSNTLVEALSARGIDAIQLTDADTIAGVLAARAHPHDVIAILSNGGFGGLHGKLLDLLRARFGDERERRA